MLLLMFAGAPPLLPVLGRTQPLLVALRSCQLGRRSSERFSLAREAQNCYNSIGRSPLRMIFCDRTQIRQIVSYASD